MVNATTSDGNSSDTTCQGGMMERIYKDDGSSTAEQSWDYQIWNTWDSRPHKKTEVQQIMKEYPQVRKTGVDAVHENCPRKVYNMKKKCKL